MKITQRSQTRKKEKKEKLRKNYTEKIKFLNDTYHKIEMKN